MRSRLLPLAAAVLAASGFAGACAGNATSDDAVPKRRVQTVVVDTFRFDPTPVRVRAGDRVTWRNDDDILHTVTSGTREYAPGNGGEVIATHRDGVFDMPLDGRGATATYRFSRPGTYHYFCDRHPGMEADVEVS